MMLEIIDDDFASIAVKVLWWKFQSHTRCDCQRLELTLCFKCDVRSGLSSFLTVTEWLNISRGPLLICPPGINVWVLAIEQWRHTHKHSEHKVLTKQLFLFYAEKHTFTIQTQIWSPLPVQLLLWKEDINCSICYFGGLGQQLKVAMEPIFEPTVQSQQNNK